MKNYKAAVCNQKKECKSPFFEDCFSIWAIQIKKTKFLKILKSMKFMD
jgi:hypothetical protein